MKHQRLAAEFGGKKNTRPAARETLGEQQESGAVLLVDASRERLFAKVARHQIVRRSCLESGERRRWLAALGPVARASQTPAILRSPAVAPPPWSMAERSCRHDPAFGQF